MLFYPIISLICLLKGKLFSLIEYNSIDELSFKIILIAIRDIGWEFLGCLGFEWVLNGGRRYRASRTSVFDTIEVVYRFIWIDSGVLWVHLSGMMSIRNKNLYGSAILLLGGALGLCLTHENGELARNLFIIH